MRVRGKTLAKMVISGKYIIVRVKILGFIYSFSGTYPEGRINIKFPSNSFD